MDNQLKLSIVTALDAAGLKKTSSEINKLTSQVNKFNASGSKGVAGLNGGIMKLPASLGKVGGALRGVAAAAGWIGAVVTAVVALYEGFKALHTFLGKHFGDTLPWLKTQAQLHEELVGKIKKEHDAAVDYGKTMQKLSEEQAKFQQRKSTDSDNNIKAINAETKAYISQAQTLNGLRSGHNDARTLQLQMQKFEEQRYYQSIGNEDAAEQIGKYYDVGIKQLQMENALKENAMETLKTEEQLKANEKLMAEYAKQVSDARLYVRQGKDLLDGAYATRYKSAQHYKNYLQADAEYRRRKDYLFDKRLKYNEARVAKDDTLGALEKLEIDKANVYSSSALALGQAAWDYDRQLLTRGDAIGTIVDENWAKELNDIQQKSWETNQGILENTADLAKKIDELLSMK